MIGALLRVRRQRTLNYLRYHLDAGTLVRVALLAGLLMVIGGGPFSSLGGWFKKMQRPGFGAAWFQIMLWASPILALVFLRQARVVRRPSRESHLLFVSGARLAVMERWAALRQLERTIFPILAAALLAAGPDGTSAPFLRGATLLIGLVALSLGALGFTPMVRLGVDVPRSTRTRASSRLITGGPLRGLIARDLIHLTRRSPGTFILLACAGLIEFLVARSMSTSDSGPAALIVTHFLFATLIVNMLMGLFERDAAHAGLLRMLPISGHRFWLARLLLAWTLAVLPAMPGVVLAGTSGILPPGIWIGFFIIPLSLAILYANVGVALFPRIMLAVFFLNIATALLVMSWFLTPLATLAVAVLVLGIWSRRAPRAFENWEAA